jgi:hypothetical protein
MQVKVPLALQGKPAIQPDTPFPALYGNGGKAAQGSPCKVLMDGVLLIP